jgi:hypothetical protein
MVGAVTTEDLDEINVQRINVREPDGRLRCVISNAAKLPGAIVRGQEYEHPRAVAGFLFFNDEETENGGLIFSGANGQTGGSLTFDAYEQDQIVQVVGTQDDSGAVAGLIVNDRPSDRSIADDLQKLMDSDASTEEKPPGYYGARRLFLGTEQGEASLNLCDGQGRARLRLRVTHEGEASIEFLDEDGTVRQTLGP